MVEMPHFGQKLAPISNSVPQALQRMNPLLLFQGSKPCFCYLISVYNNQDTVTKNYRLYRFSSGFG